jgi:hypothetical protein
MFTKHAQYSTVQRKWYRVQATECLWSNNSKSAWKYLYSFSGENTVNYMEFCNMISPHYLVDNYVQKKSDKFLFFIIVTKKSFRYFIYKNYYTYMYRLRSGLRLLSAPNMNLIRFIFAYTIYSHHSHIFVQNILKIRIQIFDFEILCTFQVECGSPLRTTV